MTDAEAAQVLRQLPLIEGPLPPDAYAAIERAIELLERTGSSAEFEETGDPL